MSDSPAPKPRPVPRPGATPQPGTQPVAPVARDRKAELEKARAFGRVDENNTVFVKVVGGEREVGQYPDADNEQALNYFAKKYLELVESADLLAERLKAGANGETIRQAAVKQREALAEALVVGDLNALETSLSELEERAKAAHTQQQKQHEQAREEGRQARAAIVEEAESIAGTDPARVQWKNSSKRMNELFDRWKELQASTPRLPKDQDQELWGRFSKARNSFDRHRREFFNELDKRSAEGKRIKEGIVAEAESLSNSTDWRETAAKYRKLVDKWKAAPRARRKEDDALWARFRAAQDVFFNARNAQNEALDAEYQENLKVKEELLEQARALLPIEDIEATRKKLRDIQEKWEDAGRVPRADVSRMEGGLRDIERALSDAENDEWKRTNPETKARTSGVMAQLEDALEELRKELETAREKGAQKRIAEAEEALNTKQAWYDQLSKTAQELD
ncbi:DUF349 domain-containing protein [Brevibacterium sp. UMB1308A]|uniref:DUF349 domain-containing protein n=1 Tax=Brevibacterium sp. UMB1308A TaxID=3050608 RepID=UPI00254CA6F8|nr:DUF349 domain-containing protein [Brevibacterium sp. UMB1308A]MDK8345965.1 DUF349 domain-containing protein [Brevibacterium sp. UMB1308B]MDK8712935.1 DUF349 domain-containing protein [Brevibacterium sp. UMB1308A]